MDTLEQGKLCVCYYIAKAALEEQTEDMTADAQTQVVKALVEEVKRVAANSGDHLLLVLLEDFDERLGRASRGGTEQRIRTLYAKFVRQLDGLIVGPVQLALA